MADKIELGPEIPVNGVRPDWLDDDDFYVPKSTSGDVFQEPRSEGTRKSGHLNWYNTAAIRLPANHEYYRRKEPTSEPVAPPGYVLVKQMSEGEWKAWAKRMHPRWEQQHIEAMLRTVRSLHALRPETRLEQFERESGIAITDGNRDAVVAALEWGRDAGTDG